MIKETQLVSGTAGVQPQHCLLHSPCVASRHPLSLNRVAEGPSRHERC